MEKGQAQIASVAIGALVFLIILSVYGSVWTAYNGIVNANENARLLTLGVQSLVNLIPLVLVGAAIVGIMVVAFKLGQ